jgi:signal transduction histidine kinase/CheY-like chemotaxis protein
MNPRRGVWKSQRAEAEIYEKSGNQKGDFMERTLRILHLEDDLRDAELVREMLFSEGLACTILRVDTQAAFIDALEQSGFELIFADYSLPAFDGISALNFAKEKTPDIPFIFITGKMGEDRAIETLKHGATDYILKDNLSRLVPSVNRALRELREKMEHKRSREVLEFSHLLLQIVNRRTAIDSMLKEVIEGIKKFTGCAAVGIRLLDDKGKIPCEDLAGFAEDFYKLGSPLSLDSDRCLYLNVIKETTNPELPFYTAGGSFYINGTTRSLETVLEEDRGETGLTSNKFGYQSVAVVPIRVERNIIGVVLVADPRENQIPLGKVETLEDVALQLGMAIQHTKVEERLKESEVKLRHLSSELMAAQEKERKRIAGELHDSIVASLSAIKISIEKIFDQMGPDDWALARSKNLIELVKQTIEETRRIMADLRPSILDDLGVIPAINWFCREFQKIYSGLFIEKQIDIEEDDISDGLKTPIFRIFQETLNNVAKHSQATLVKLSLSKSPREIKLLIADNGQGFDPELKSRAEGTKGGLGLVSMRERAELSGGSFSLESQKGAGTTVRVSWNV